jgi:hypothetical protein
MTPVRNRKPEAMSSAINCTMNVRLNHAPVEGRVSGNCTKKSGSDGFPISGNCTNRSGSAIVLGTMTPGMVVPGAVVAVEPVVVVEPGVVVVVEPGVVVVVEPGVVVVVEPVVVVAAIVVVGRIVVVGGIVVAGGAEAALIATERIPESHFSL